MTQQIDIEKIKAALNAIESVSLKHITLHTNKKSKILI